MCTGKLIKKGMLKMKKISVLLLTFVICVLAASCGKGHIKPDEHKTQVLPESRYTSYSIDTETGSSGSNGAIFWEKPAEQKIAETKHICYEGREYDLSYSKSQFEGICSPSYVDEYYDEELNRFCFKTGTDELCGYNKCFVFLDMSDYNYEPITIEAAQEIANSFFSRHANVEDYVVSVSEDTKSEGYIRYRFKYVKHLGGLPTMDYAVVAVGNDGTVVGFNIADLGLSKDKKFIEFDEKEVENAVAIKVDDLYGSKYKYSYTEGEKYITWSTKGDLLLVTEVQPEYEMPGSGITMYPFTMLVATVIE